jgi:hypothetical protein
VLRVGPCIFAIVLVGASAALAAEPIALNEIQATFFTGQPLTAISPLKNLNDHRNYGCSLVEITSNGPHLPVRFSQLESAEAA